jgi:hypothetical protein
MSVRRPEWRLAPQNIAVNPYIVVRFEVFTAVTMKNAVFWDIKPPVRIPQETHYVSATEPSQLILFKI